MFHWRGYLGCITWIMMEALVIIQCWIGQLILEQTKANPNS